VHGVPSLVMVTGNAKPTFRFNTFIVSRIVHNLFLTKIVLAAIISLLLLPSRTLSFPTSGPISARRSMDLDATPQLPKLVAFDLDGTIWTPDMYQLWGGGAPFTVVKDGKQELKDVSGRSVRLLGVAGVILEELKTQPAWANTKVAWVSCTDEPEWADECLRKFKTSPSGLSIGETADSSQIFKAVKTTHFKKLKEQYPGIDYTDMLFFDNESHNIRSVATLGVKAVGQHMSSVHTLLALLTCFNVAYIDRCIALME
jgi:magnesium-dependent phosphatase 1